MFRLIGVIFGILYWQSFWGALGGFLIGSLIDGIRKIRVVTNSRTTNRDDFIKYLLIFTTIVAKSDNGKLLRAELDYVKSYLLRILGAQRTQEALLVLRDMLNTEYDTFTVSQQFGGKASIHEKLMMLQFLFGLSAADGSVSDLEMAAIRNISANMGISHNDFESLKAMFFGYQGRYTGGYSSSTSYQPTYNIDNDYKVLEIESSATNEEVKKAYRKLAMKHHPDKVNHLGDEIRKAAEERFAKLNESYERIKKVRGMN